MSPPGSKWLVRSVSPLQSPLSCPTNIQPTETALLTYSCRIKRALPFPLLPLPDVQQVRRKVLHSNFTPRRSPRLASSYPNRAPATQCTQLIPAATMGVTSDTASGTVSKFHKLFGNLLSIDHIKAPAALFRMLVPATLPSETISIATPSSVIAPVPAC